MADFNLAIPVVLQHEGGSTYTDDPNDPGGATKYGISLAFLQNHPADGDFNGDGVVNAADIQMMTQDEAEGLYQKYFWDPNQYGLINSQMIATKVFDTAVNIGSRPANRLLQQAVNAITAAQLVVDGILGPISIAAINAVPQEQTQLVIDNFANQQWAYYQNLIANNPNLAIYANGWKNRAYDA